MARKKKAQPKRLGPTDWPPLPGWHGLLTPIIANYFAQLGVSVALWIRENFWHAIHVVPNVTNLESNLGVVNRRWAYNFRQFEVVKTRRALVRGEHAGFFDLFLPVQHENKVAAVLVTGPFAVARPTSADLERRWFELTGLRGRLTDPTFAEYVSATLSTLTLEGSQAGVFEELMQNFAILVSDQGDAAARAEYSAGLARTLLAAREAESMWEAAHQMIDERSAVAWPGYGRTIMQSFGVVRGADHVVVGLLGAEGQASDSLDLLLRRDAFQRECVKLARRFGGLISGRVGDHGVSFLFGKSPERPRARRKIGELVHAAGALARRFHFSLKCGVAHCPEGAPLPPTYREALWAAEKALAERVRVIYGEPHPEQSADLLRQLRDALEKSIEERPDLLLPRFDRYAQVVLVHTGFRIDAARIELELGLERLVGPLRAVSLIDPKALSEMHATQERAAAEARTVTELTAAYRSMVSGIQLALQSPVEARQERSTSRALAYVREHLSEPIDLRRGARAAGLAPSHFARLFRQNEGVSFARHVRNLRVVRAKDMLGTTELSIEQIQKLCGFGSRGSFYRVFRGAVKKTPAEYRAESWPERLDTDAREPS